MKERGILFSDVMVRALLREENPKTQTRRIVKPQPVLATGVWGGLYLKPPTDHGKDINCPYGVPGDRLWVRETYLTRLSGASVIYRADIAPVEAAGISGMYGGWKPSIFMPRKFSRITLEITDVRVERLNEISSKDAIAEGVEYDVSKSGGWPPERFKALWESINGKGSWESNPWVWALSFRRIKP